jgi:hypothetical protein
MDDRHFSYITKVEKKNPDYEKASFIIDPMAGVFERE